MKQRSRLMAFSLLLMALTGTIGTISILQQQSKVLAKDTDQTQLNTLPQQEAQVPPTQSITNSTPTPQIQLKQSTQQQQRSTPSQKEQNAFDTIDESVQSIDTINESVQSIDTINESVQSIDTINETIPSNQTDLTEQPLNSTFRVSTDYGYFCNSGNAQDAIQDAIESLPERDSAANVYLEGQFDNLSHVCLSSNIDIVGPATLTSEDCYCMFWTNCTNLYPYPYYWQADYVSIVNVSFNNLNLIGKNVTIGIYGTLRWQRL
jgi:hypothetical protein